jgi:hypothetical protein
MCLYISLDSVYTTLPINVHRFSIRIIRMIRPWQYGTDLVGLTARSNVRLRLLPLECQAVVRRRSGTELVQSSLLSADSGEVVGSIDPEVVG